MNKTPIEWVRTYNPDGTYEPGFTVNPVRFRPYGSSQLTTMCQKISPGCTNCYAAGIVRRFWPAAADNSFPGYTAQGLATGEFVLDDKQLLSVLRRRKPCRIFWGDMTDMFGAWVPDRFLQRCFAVCGLTPHIEHIFLTKRPLIMANLLCGPAGYKAVAEALIGQHVSQLHLHRTGDPVSEWSGLPMPNVILGCSVEDQPRADERVAPMAQLSAAGWRTMVSYEPALGPVDWSGWKFLDWLISGGESGPQARPSHPAWHRAACAFCAANQIPYFFKQWGAWRDRRLGDSDLQPRVRLTDEGADGHVLGCAGGNDVWMQNVGKHAAGAELYGHEYRAFPEVPHA